MRLLGSAVAGIHSMIDEHFGISVVEYMAAGAIPIGRQFEFLFQIKIYSLYISMLVLVIMVVAYKFLLLF